MRSPIRAGVIALAQWFRWSRAPQARRREAAVRGHRLAHTEGPRPERRTTGCGGFKIWSTPTPRWSTPTPAQRSTMRSADAEDLLPGPTALGQARPAGSSRLSTFAADPDVLGAERFRSTHRDGGPGRPHPADDDPVLAAVDTADLVGAEQVRNEGARARRLGTEAGVRSGPVSCLTPLATSVVRITRIARAAPGR